MSWINFDASGVRYLIIHCRMNYIVIVLLLLLYSAWWKTNSLEGTGPLHSMNPIRMYFIREQIIRSLKAINMPTDLSDLKILDVGCGGIFKH